MRAYLISSLVLFACHQTPSQQTPPPEDGPPAVNPDVAPQIGEDADVVDQPTTPRTEDGRTLNWTEAPLMPSVKVVTNRDSAIVEVPVVDGAADYRVFRLGTGVSLEGTKVLGASIHCAGYRQRNAKAPAARELLRRIEVTGIDKKATLVVEALDRPCPFPGAMGNEHATRKVTSSEVEADARVTFDIFTADEIRARYGSLIRNGHGKATTLAQPAPVEDAAPNVLSRTTIAVQPLGITADPPTTFFEDFANDADQPVFVREVDNGGRNQRGKLFQSSRWSFYTYGADPAQFFIENGQLQSLLADWDQAIFASNIAYPREPVQLDDTQYLKVTFDVASNATSRRYWWLVLCGAQAAGQTMNEDGTLKGRIVQTPFFYQDDGKNPSVEGWNCFQIFPRDGWPFDLKPSNTRPESDVRVMVNTAGAGDRDSVVNVSPDQYHNKAIATPSWYRQQDPSGTLASPIMDRDMLVAPRQRVVLFLRRDRAVLFVDGEQRLCNDFPTHKLTMAEGALGFGQVLYHSTAERPEFSRDFWMRTGQYYYLENMPYVDVRSWDNLGYSEKVPQPAELDTSKCYVSP